MQIILARMYRHVFGRLKPAVPVLLGLLFVASPCWSQPQGTRDDRRAVRERTDTYEGQRPARRDRSRQKEMGAGSANENTQRLRHKAREWDDMPPRQQEELRHRMDRFKSMPPEERSLYRKRFEQMQQLPPDQQQDVRNKLRRMDRLSPQEKEEIRRKFE